MSNFGNVPQTLCLVYEVKLRPRGILRLSVMLPCIAEGEALTCFGVDIPRLTAGPRPHRVTVVEYRSRFTGDTPSDGNSGASTHWLVYLITSRLPNPLTINSFVFSGWARYHPRRAEPSDGPQTYGTVRQQIDWYGASCD